YDKHIAQGMRWGIPGDFIHGDLHTNNVIVGDTVHIIDWEYAKRGFMEFDLYKLFTKSGVEGDLEKRLVEYAAQRKDAVSKFPHFNRQCAYNGNAITQDLFTAVRYLKRSDEAPTHKKERLEKMAVVSYNNALRRLDALRGYIEVREALEEHVAQSMPRLRRLSDEEFARMNARYNPHSHVSQENLLTSDADLPKDAAIDEELKRHYLRTIKKNLRKRDWWTFAKRVLAAGVLVGAALGANTYMKNAEERRVQDAERMELLDRVYVSSFTSSYQTLVEAQLNGGLRQGYYSIERTPLRPVDYFGKDNLVKTTCARHNVPVRLVENMYSVNAVAGGSHESGAELKGLRLLDPYRQWNSDRIDPVRNLETGVTRLSSLFDKYGVDRKKLEQTLNVDGYPAVRDHQRSLVSALTEFYAAEKGNTTPYPDDITIPPTVRKIVYNVLRGGPGGDETGMWLDEPPKRFTLK
ncbi:MAG: phosphotransferase, partial [Nanoarchaeota archaeon]